MEYKFLHTCIRVMDLDKSLVLQKHWVSRNKKKGFS